MFDESGQRYESLELRKGNLLKKSTHLLPLFLCRFEFNLVPENLVLLARLHCRLVVCWYKRRVEDISMSMKQGQLHTEGEIINFHISAILIILSISNNKFRIYRDTPGERLSTHKFPTVDRRQGGRLSEPKGFRCCQTENIHFLFSDNQIAMVSLMMKRSTTIQSEAQQKSPS